MFSAFPVVSLLCPSSCMVPEPELEWNLPFWGLEGGRGGEAASAAVGPQVSVILSKPQGKFGAVQHGL